MARLPVDPRLSKFLLLACDDEDGDDLRLAGDALVIAALASISGSVFFRVGTLDGVQLADQQKIQFCNELGDFITMLELFKAWVNIPEYSKSKWCVANSINAKSMRIARDTMKDIKASLRRDVGLRVEENWEPSSEADHLRLAELLFGCFRENLCVYSGHPKTGYINLRTREVCRLHPGTSLCYLGNVAPELVVYDQVNSMSVAIYMYQYLFLFLLLQKIQQSTSTINFNLLNGSIYRYNFIPAFYVKHFIGVLLKNLLCYSIFTVMKFYWH
jgi:ATP-dependent RNA helicase DHX8/PRP22